MLRISVITLFMVLLSGCHESPTEPRVDSATIRPLYRIQGRPFRRWWLWHDDHRMKSISSTGFCRVGVPRGNRVALARVGSPAVRLCRSFARLSDQRAAIILIHEALHFAGQTEYPSDSRAPDGTAITKMVMESCRLS